MYTHTYICRAIIPPLTSESARSFGEGASVEQFEIAMNKIKNALTIHLDSRTNSDTDTDSSSSSSNSNSSSSSSSSSNSGGYPKSMARFFIASSNNEFKRQLVAKFPNALFLSGETSRSLTEGILFALIEWLILAESALIVHTFGSTFSAEAAMINRIPLIGLWEDRFLHHYHPHIPACGHLQFAKLRAVSVSHSLKYSPKFDIQTNQFFLNSVYFDCTAVIWPMDSITIHRRYHRQPCGRYYISQSDIVPLPLQLGF